jgi:hypothetical protein
VEAGLKRAVMRLLETDYPAAVVRKRHGSIYSTAGDPDIYFLLAGTHVECELKQPHKEPTPLQQVRLAEWAAAGALTAVIHTIPEMRAFMAAHFPPPRGACLGNDPLCPCQDGDICHYRGPNAWPVPA